MTQAERIQTTAEHIRSPRRIQTPYLTAEDELDRSLRPRSSRTSSGRAVLREQLAVAIEAAAARGEALDHLLLAGPPGLGKTRSPRSSRPSWMCPSCRPPGRRSSARATSRPF